MFGVIAALNSFFSNQREGREALIYENYIRTGQGLLSNKIYRESSVDKQVRKELGAIRYKERLQQQVKFVRLMKKLLIKANRHGEIDEDLEQMRIKVAQLELKVERAARAKDINCEDMFNMDKPDDTYDIELEQIIRTATSNVLSTENDKLKHDDKAGGDHVNIQISYKTNDNPHDSGDQVHLERIRKKQ